jgi:tetratricopeptide (TPR) repeat protein
MLGKGLEAWDEKLGGHLNSINLTTVKSTYKTLLDQLFDKNDYSEMGLSQVRRTKKESGDEPRSYQAALKTIEELEGMANKDVKFKKSVLPSIVALKDSVSKANTYFAMRLQQAECLSLLKKYKEASSVFIALSKYFVEYPQIRIELAKAKVAQETKEGYLKAEKLFKDLLSVVPGPSVSSYEPMEFFSLQWWYTRTRLALSEEKGAKSTESVIEAWKYLRSMVYQDLGYIGKSERRFTQLRIAGTQKVNHEDMIDQFKTWVEQEIFPVLEKSNSPLKKDSWTSILGGEQ